MCNPVTGVLFAVAMIAVVVGVDLLFFRVERWFWQRLAANIGIVLSFEAFSFNCLLRNERLTVIQLSSSRAKRVTSTRDNAPRSPRP